MAAKPDILIEVFEVIRSKRGNVLISFVGAHRIPDQAKVIISGRDVVVERGSHPRIKFCGLRDRELDFIRKAKLLYVNRSFRWGDEYVSQVRLQE